MSASAAPSPPNEQRRIQELREYGLLDRFNCHGCENVSRQDPELDRITRMAARICQVPMALISIVSGKKQWFLANEGLREEPPAAPACSPADGAAPGT